MSTLRVLMGMLRCGQDKRLDAHRIAELQERRFRRLLRHAYRNSSFYREYYKQHNIKENHLQSIRVADLPPITKSTMMENFDRVLCVPGVSRAALEEFIDDPANRRKKYDGKYTVMHTSGSSGTVGIFVFGPKDWAVVKANTLSRVAKVLPIPFRRIKLAFIGAIDGNYGGITLTADAPSWLYNQLHLSIDWPVPKSVERLNRFQPNVMNGYSSGLNMLATEQLKGDLHIHPVKVFCSGDPLTPIIRDNIRRAFNLEPKNLYAATESLFMGLQEKPDEDMLLFNDWHIYEIVDRHMREVQPGEPGNLILTNLYNYTQPLIRYQMNDTLVPSPPQAGAYPQFQRISTLEGRTGKEIIVKNSDGEQVRISPSLLGAFFVPGLEKFQYFFKTDKKTGACSLLMRAKVHGDPEKRMSAIRRKMAEVMEMHHLTLDFSIEAAKDIENDPKTKKFRLLNFQ